MDFVDFSVSNALQLITSAHIRQVLKASEIHKELRIFGDRFEGSNIILVVNFWHGSAVEALRAGGYLTRGIRCDSQTGRPDRLLVLLKLPFHSKAPNDVQKEAQRIGAVWKGDL